MRKLFLHIGTHKTGTSSIQRFLYENNDILMKNSVFYLKEFTNHDAHHDFAKCFTDMDDEKNKRFLSSYRKKVQTIKSGIFILSSENFGWLLHGKSIEYLYKYLDVFDEINIIAYFREPSSYLKSFYQTTVNDPKTRNKMIPTQYFENSKSLLGTNYRLYIEKWLKTFKDSKTITKNFENIKSNLIKDFLDTIKFDFSNKFSDESLNIQANKSFNFKYIEILRALNEINISQADFLKIRNLMQSMKNMSEEEYYNKNLLEEYRNFFLDINEGFFDKTTAEKDTHK